MFVCDCYFDFGSKWQLQKTNSENNSENFVIYNFLCSNLFDNVTKMVDINDLCLNCKRHFLNAILIKFHCF